jgi:hypothetical protein
MHVGLLSFFLGLVSGKKIGEGHLMAKIMAMSCHA